MPIFGARHRAGCLFLQKKKENATIYRNEEIGSELRILTKIPLMESISFCRMMRQSWSKYNTSKYPGSFNSSLSAPNRFRKAAGGRGNDTPKEGSRLVSRLKGSNEGFNEAPRNVKPTCDMTRRTTCERVGVCMWVCKGWDILLVHLISLGHW